MDVKEADAAIYVISRNSGEGKDRRAEKGDYYLSDRELQNIRFMTEHFKNCIVLLIVCLAPVPNNAIFFVPA